MVRKRRSGSADIFSAALKYFTLRGYLTLEIGSCSEANLDSGEVPPSLNSQPIVLVPPTHFSNINLSPI